MITIHMETADLIRNLRTHFRDKGDTEGLDLLDRLEQAMRPGSFFGLAKSTERGPADAHRIDGAYAAYLSDDGNIEWKLIEPPPLDENHKTMID